MQTFLIFDTLSGSHLSHCNFHMFQDSLSGNLGVALIQILGDIITAK